MGKENKRKLPVDIRCGDNIYHVEEFITDKVVLYDIQKQLVVKIEFKDGDPESGELIINNKWNLELKNKPGVKKLNEIIFDQDDVLKTVHSFIDKSLEQAETELAEVKNKISLLKENRKRFSGDDIDEVLTNIGGKRTIIVNVPKNNQDSKDEYEVQEKIDKVFKDVDFEEIR